MRCSEWRTAAPPPPPALRFLISNMTFGCQVTLDFHSLYYSLTHPEHWIQVFHSLSRPQVYKPITCRRLLQAFVKESFALRAQWTPAWCRDRMIPAQQVQRHWVWVWVWWLPGEEYCSDCSLKCKVWWTGAYGVRLFYRVWPLPLCSSERNSHHQEHLDIFMLPTLWKHLEDDLFVLQHDWAPEHKAAP